MCMRIYILNEYTYKFRYKIDKIMMSVNSIFGRAYKTFYCISSKQPKILLHKSSNNKKK